MCKKFFVFATIELKPTLPGAVLSVLYKPPQLRIRLGFEDGTFRTYRTVAKMMSTEFLLSPLVSSTEQFAALETTRSHTPDQTVRSMTVTPVYGGGAFWRSTYRLTMKRYIQHRFQEQP